MIFGMLERVSLGCAQQQAPWCWSEMHPLLRQRPPADGQKHVSGCWCSQVMQFIHPHYFPSYYWVWGWGGLSLFVSIVHTPCGSLAAHRLSNGEMQYYVRTYVIKVHFCLNFKNYKQIKLKRRISDEEWLIHDTKNMDNTRTFGGLKKGRE